MFGRIRAIWNSYRLHKNKGRVFEMDSLSGGGWGNSIKFSGSNKNICTGTILRVVGWKQTRPRKGDYLRTRMASGKVGIAKFVKVELCTNPCDMFFGDAKMLGYDLDYDEYEVHQ